MNFITILFCVSVFHKKKKNVGFMTSNSRTIFLLRPMIFKT